MTPSAPTTCVRVSLSLLKLPGRVAVVSPALVTRERIISKLNGFPDRNTEYFLYQTMIGAWPIERDRLDRLYGKGCARSEAAYKLDTAEQGI